MKTPRQILNEAALLLECGYTRKGEAINASGQIVDARDSNAVAWDAGGAILRAAERDEDGFKEAMNMLREFLESRYGDRDVTRWSNSFPSNGGRVVAVWLRKAAEV